MLESCFDDWDNWAGGSEPLGGGSARSVAATSRPPKSAPWKMSMHSPPQLSSTELTRRALGRLPAHRPTGCRPPTRAARGTSRALQPMTVRITLVVLGFALLAATPALAHHQPVTVALAARPTLTASVPWGLMLVVREDGKPIARRPRLHATLGSTKRSFAARTTARRGYYRVRVVLPRPGRWTLAAQVGRRTEALGRIRVRAA
jgi:hypothetical protein